MAQGLDIMRYAPAIIILHWLTALALIAVIGLGLSHDLIEDKVWRAAVLNLHRSIGLVIFALMLARLALRFLMPTPPLPAMAQSLVRLARGVHGGLYALMLGMPIGGYLATSARGREVILFGLVTLPPLLEPDRALGKLLNDWHKLGQWPIYALVLAHVGAALYHQFWLKDRLMARMGLGQPTLV